MPITPFETYGGNAATGRAVITGGLSGPGTTGSASAGPCRPATLDPGLLKPRPACMQATTLGRISALRSRASDGRLRVGRVCGGPREAADARAVVRRPSATPEPSQPR